MRAVEIQTGLEIVPSLRIREILRPLEAGFLAIQLSDWRGVGHPDEEGRRKRDRENLFGPLRLCVVFGIRVAADPCRRLEQRRGTEKGRVASVDARRVDVQVGADGR